jgi:hypothetical protein
MVPDYNFPAAVVGVRSFEKFFTDLPNFMGLMAVELLP